jgi:urate oxidase
LYAIGEAALASVPEIDSIELTMPNKHYLLADLSRFGKDNPNEIFVPIDEPHGTIEARLRRQG